MSNSIVELSYLHPDRILRMRELQVHVGLSASHIYALIAQGKFPRPFKLVPGGRAAAWRLGAIVDWLAAQERAGQEAR